MRRNLILLCRGPIQRGNGAFEGVEYQRGHGRPRRCRNQRGFGIAMRFKGDPFQRGHGFWSKALGWFMRRVAPRAIGGVKTVAKEVANMAKEQALSTGTQILGDIASGENVGETIKSRLVRGGRELAATGKRKLEEKFPLQGGTGRKRRRKASISAARKRKTVSCHSEVNAKRRRFKSTSLPYKHIFE